MMTAKRSAKVIKLQPPLRCAEPTPADMELEEDDIAWATRSGMWQSRVAKASARRTKRAKAQPALILAGHGVSLRIENGALTIQNGFTHYPQQREIIRYFRGDVALPERIILLDGSGSISFDVLSWLAEQKVSLIRIDWKGDIVCVAGASGYSANPFRVRWQLETRENPEQRNEFCRSIITRKIEATIITLEKSIPRSDKWERAMKSAYAALSRLDENPPETISELRALEANCAASYFRSWVGMPIKWRGTSRRPIPDNWHSIGAALVAVSFGRQSQCGAPGQCDIELRLCRARKRNSDQGHFRGLRSDNRDYARRQRRIVEIHFRFNGAGAAEGRSCGVGFRQRARFRSGGFCHSQRRRLPA